MISPCRFASRCGPVAEFGGCDGCSCIGWSWWSRGLTLVHWNALRRRIYPSHKQILTLLSHVHMSRCYETSFSFSASSPALSWPPPARCCSRRCRWSPPCRPRLQGDAPYRRTCPRMFTATRAGSWLRSISPATGSRFKRSRRSPRMGPGSAKAAASWSIFRRPACAKTRRFRLEPSATAQAFQPRSHFPTTVPRRCD